MQQQKDIFSVEEKIVLITGSSRGLGFTFARAFGMKGAKIILNGRDATTLEQAAKSLEALGMQVFTSVFDVFDESSVKKEINRIEKKIGPIDVLINNAGINKRAPLEQLSLKDWNDVLRVNLTGAFIVSREVVQRMIPRESGKIINICSLMSEVGRPTTAPYAASKGGIKMLTKAMTVEWAKYNIQVNGIGPGYFITEMTQKLADDREFDSWIRNRTPAGRWGDPNELTGTAIFLASEASSFVNGQVIYVDGGLLAGI